MTMNSRESAKDRHLRSSCVRVLVKGLSFRVAKNRIRVRMVMSRLMIYCGLACMVF